MNTAAKNQNNSADASDLTSQIEALRSELGSLTQTVTEFGTAKAASARDAVVDQTETARLQAMMLQDDANDFIKRQPATALSIAVGFGFLVGFLGTRR